MEHRNPHRPECRGRHSSRRQHGSSRTGEGRQGSAVSETSRHARTSSTGTWEAFQPPRPQGRGRQSQGRSRAEDARLEGVGPGHSSEETGEQSGGCAVAEPAERRAGRNGSTQQAKHGPDTEPDFPRHRRLRDTAVPKGCRHDRSEEPGALAGTPGSARGASGNRRPTATVQRYHYLGYRQPLGTHLLWWRGAGEKGMVATTPDPLSPVPQVV